MVDRFLEKIWFRGVFGVMYNKKRKQKGERGKDGKMNGEDQGDGPGGQRGRLSRAIDGRLKGKDLGGRAGKVRAIADGGQSELACGRVTEG